MKITKVKETSRRLMISTWDITILKTTYWLDCTMHWKLQKLYNTKRNESELRRREKRERERERERERSTAQSTQLAHSRQAKIHNAGILRGCCRLLARQTWTYLCSHVNNLKKLTQKNLSHNYIILPTMMLWAKGILLMLSCKVNGA